MSEKEIHPRDPAQLRRRAAEMARREAALAPNNIDGLTHGESLRKLHELRVHQIELEMQNEELLRTHVELDAARARYFDFYDLAPVGFFTVSEHAQFVEFPQAFPVRQAVDVLRRQCRFPPRHLRGPAAQIYGITGINLFFRHGLPPLPASPWPP